MKIKCTILLFLFVFSFQYSADRITGRTFVTRSEVFATQGMVAASQPLAAQVGIDILKRGGSAMDAAIAVNATLGLMEPTGSGIGGDLFAIVWDQKEKKLFGLNASGPAPRSLNLNIFKKKGLTEVPLRGPLPWTVPGCVDGWFLLHKKFGKLPMSTVLAPAIQYAENGFPLSELIAYYWNRSLNLFKKYENFQKLYSIEGGLVKKGDIFKNPLLAKTYRLLASRGRDAFYNGPITRLMVDYSHRVAGFFELDDFKTFTSEWVDPVCVDYKGYRLWELPPNGQGIAALQMLNMLKHLDLKKMGHNSADYLHALIEAKKIVYEDRARFYADPGFAPAPLKMLLSNEYAKERLKLYDPMKASLSLPHGDDKLEAGDTVYLTVVDKDFNAVSLIQSNYSGFGSGMVPDGVGFCIQDRGALFSLDEGHPNVVAPGKRPFHTIIPAMVTKDGRPVFTYGVMGGSMQPQGHVQVLLNILEFGFNIQEAGDADRFRHGGSSQPTGGTMKDGGTVYLESGISAQTVRDLLARGHRISWVRGSYGGYQGIWIDWKRGVLIGASESRKDGCAIGY